MYFKGGGASVSNIQSNQINRSPSLGKPYQSELLKRPSKNKSTRLSSALSFDCDELKVKFNRLSQEHKQVKTKLTKVKNQNMRLQKVTKQIEVYLQSKSLKSENLILGLLKRQSAQQKKQIQELRRMISEKNKRSKITNSEELEIEMKNFIQETIRLKAVIKGLNRPSASQVQERIQNSLHEQIEQYKGKLRVSQYQRDKLSSKFKMLQKDVESSNLRIGKLQSQLKIKVAIIEKLQYQNKAMFYKKNNDERHTSLSLDHQRIKSLQKEIQIMKAVLVRKEQEYASLERIFLQSKKNQKQNEVKHLQEIHRYELDIINLKDSLDKQIESSQLSKILSKPKKEIKNQSICSLSQLSLQNSPNELRLSDFKAQQRLIIQALGPQKEKALQFVNKIESKSERVSREFVTNRLQRVGQRVLGMLVKFIFEGQSGSFDQQIQLAYLKSVLRKLINLD